MFGLSLSPVVCRTVRVLYTLFVHSGVHHILCCVCVLFVFVLCLVYPMLPVSLDFPFVITLRYSLTFISIVMVNNSIIINKTNNHLWRHNIEHTKTTLWHWQYISWFETVYTKMLRIKSVKLHHCISVLYAYMHVVCSCKVFWW